MVMNAHEMLDTATFCKKKCSINVGDTSPIFLFSIDIILIQLTHVTCTIERLLLIL